MVVVLAGLLKSWLLTVRPLLHETSCDQHMVCLTVHVSAWWFSIAFKTKPGCHTFYDLVVWLSAVALHGCRRIEHPRIEHPRMWRPVVAGQLGSLLPGMVRLVSCYK
jgi:hypothetical protein